MKEKEVCVVFGGNGFIGSNLTKGLVNQGYEVRVFDRFSSKKNNLKEIINRIELIKGDFLNEDDINDALEGADFVFHYISASNPYSSSKDPIFEIKTNIIGSVKLFQAAVSKGVKKIFFSSSGGTVYGENPADLISENSPLMPKNPYGISKVTIENYLRYFYHHHGIEYMIFRYSNPYGEYQDPYANQGVIPIFLNKIKNKDYPVIFGDGSAIRDYIYIQDAIDATLECLNVSSNGDIFNIGSGTGISLNQLVTIMSEVTGIEIHPVYVNDSAIYVSKIILDISKIQKATNWEPKVSINHGILKTWNWLRSQD